MQNSNFLYINIQQNYNISIYQDISFGCIFDFNFAIYFFFLLVLNYVVLAFYNQWLVLKINLYMCYIDYEYRNLIIIKKLTKKDLNEISSESFSEENL